MKLADVMPTQEVPLASQVGLRALHAFSFIATMASVLLGGALVFARGYEVSLGGLALAALAAILFNGAWDLYNDADDLKRGLDRLGHTVRDPAALARSETAERNLRRSAALCVVLAVLVLIPEIVPLMFERVGLMIGVFLALFAGFTYVARPRRYKYVGLGTLPEAVVLGPALTALGMIAAAPQVSVRELGYGILCSVPVMLMIGAILLGRDLRTLERDRAEGVRTMALRLGADGAFKLVAGLVAAAAVCLVALVVTGLLPAVSLLSLAALAMALPLMRGLKHAYTRGEREREQVVFRTEVMHALFAGILIVSLVWAQVMVRQGGGTGLS